MRGFFLISFFKNEESSNHAVFGHFGRLVMTGRPVALTFNDFYGTISIQSFNKEISLNYFNFNFNPIYNQLKIETP